MHNLSDSIVQVVLFSARVLVPPATLFMFKWSRSFATADSSIELYGLLPKPLS
jgi:hypothetical protein